MSLLVKLSLLVEEGELKLTIRVAKNIRRTTLMSKVTKVTINPIPRLMSTDSTMIMAMNTIKKMVLTTSLSHSILVKEQQSIKMII